MRKIIFLFLFISFSFSLKADQNNLMDELYNSLNYDNSTFLTNCENLLKIAEQNNNNDYYAKGLYKKGEYYYNIGLIDKSYENFLKSFSYFENINDNAMLVHTSIFLGLCNKKLKWEDKCKEYFEKAYKYSLKTSDLFAKASANWSLAEYYLDKDDFIKFQLYLNESDRLVNLMPTSDKYKRFCTDILFKLNLDLYSKQNQLDSIINCFDRFEQRYKELSNYNYTSQSIILQKKIIYFSKFNQFDSSLKYFKILERLEKNGIVNKELSSDPAFKNSIYKVIYKVYEQKGDTLNAYKYLVLASEYSNKSLESNPINAFKAETKTIEQKSKEQIDKSEGEKLIIMYASAIILILSTIFILILLKRNKIEKKLKEDLLISNKSKEKLFSIISHDLMSPVNSFYSLASIIKSKKNSNQEIEDYLTDNTVNVAFSIKTITENLLNWSRIQMNRFSIILDEFNVINLIDEVVFQCISFSEKKNILIQQHHSENIRILGDRYAIEIALRNVLMNAIKFTPTDGTIEINSKKIDNIFEISIADSGSGFSDELIAKINNNLVIDSKSGTQNEKGTGLGLFLIKEIIEKHDGNLHLSNSENGSAIVTIKIPIID